MKLEQYHIEWLERNDGKYSIMPDCSTWYDSENHPIINVLSMTFNNTGFQFNPGGLPDAIDSILDQYPDS